MKLSDVKIRRLLTPGRYFDGQGLYLEVLPNASETTGRYWRLKYRHGGKEKRMAFGVYPDVSLKDARSRLAEARALLAAGIDPMRAKKDAEARADSERAAAAVQAARDAENAFKLVAEEWLQHQHDRWAPATRAAVRASLEADVYPALGATPLQHIRPRDVVSVIKAIESRGVGETAGRVLQRIRAVFRYALVHDRITTNPMVDLLPGELLRPRVVQHRPALAERDVPGFLAALAAYEGDPTTKAALELLMLTVLRPGELRGLRWDEVDEAGGLLRIGAARMKMRAPHVVPLSTQAAAILQRMQPISGTGALVFPSPFYPGKSLSENTLNSAIARMGFKGIATAHGMRALFSTVANEHGHDPDIIERQLAHVERNDVRAAYHRAAYLKARGELMQWWADWLSSRGVQP
jgi:integrase